MEILVANNIEVRRAGMKPLFGGIDFEVRSGELFQIIGPNGSGKSTLLSICAGRTKPTRGKVERRIQLSQVAYVPQLVNLESHLCLTLGEVVEVLVRQALSKKQVLAQGLLKSAQLGLSWNTASGGERQRVLLTAAMLNDPKLLCLDEPLNHLDGSTREALLQAMIQFLDDDSERSVILVSHLSTALKGKFTSRAINLEADGE